MQIVIDIPDKTYKVIKNTKQISEREYYILINAIINSTSLPKGHGKLIAEPTEEDIAKTVGGQNDFAECIRDVVKEVFANATPIIESESEG